MSTSSQPITRTTVEQVSSVKPSFADTSTYGTASRQTAGDVPETTFGRSQGLTTSSTGQYGSTSHYGTPGTHTGQTTTSSLQDTSGTRTVPQESYAHRYKSLGRDRPDTVWMKILYAIFAFLVPPLTVAVKTSDVLETVINILWTILGWFPGFVHALLVAFTDTRCTFTDRLAFEPTLGDYLQGYKKEDILAANAARERVMQSNRAALQAQDSALYPRQQHQAPVNTYQEPSTAAYAGASGQGGQILGNLQQPVPTISTAPKQYAGASTVEGLGATQGTTFGRTAPASSSIGQTDRKSVV